MCHFSGLEDMTDFVEASSFIFNQEGFSAKHLVHSVLQHLQQVLLQKLRSTIAEQWWQNLTHLFQQFDNKKKETMVTILILKYINSE